MTTVELLRAARERLADPANWCKEAYSNGVQACAVGALYIAGGHRAAGAGYWASEPDPTTAAAVALHFAVYGDHTRYTPGKNELPGECEITVWNDDPERVHADILAAFDKAIVQVSA